jgi:hypothetical protein
MTCLPGNALQTIGRCFIRVAQSLQSLAVHSAGRNPGSHDEAYSIFLICSARAE